MPEIKFNTKIYKKKAIQRAISVFSRLARFQLNHKKNYINVRIDSIEAELKEILIDEFGNFVLGMTKKCL